MLVHCDTERGYLSEIRLRDKHGNETPKDAPGARSGILSTVSCLNFFPKLATRVDTCDSSNGEVCCSTCQHTKATSAPAVNQRAETYAGSFCAQTLTARAVCAASPGPVRSD